MTEAQINEIIHIAMILVTTLNILIVWLVHNRQVENRAINQDTNQQVKEIASAVKNGSQSI